MRTGFDEQLERLHSDMINMGALCEAAINGAIDAISAGAPGTGDGEFEYAVRTVAEADAEIDRSEREIEGLCMRLLLLRSPVAGDLRKISAALKMISDMERIGDQASDIAEIAKYIRGSEICAAVPIAEMSHAAANMVTESVNAYVRDDTELASAVIRADDRVDELFCRIKRDLIDILRSGDPRGEECIDMLMIAKYFERIADHATNIAEWVEFSVTGVRGGES